MDLGTQQMIAELAEIKTYLKTVLDRLEKSDNRFHRLEERVNALEHARTQIMLVGSMAVMVISAVVSAVVRMMVP